MAVPGQGGDVFTKSLRTTLIGSRPPMAVLSSVKLHRMLLVASVLLPALVMIGAATWSCHEVIREGQQLAKGMAVILDEHATKVLDTVDLLIGRVDDRIKRMNPDEISLPETSTFIEDLMAPFPQAVSIWVSDAQGRILAGSQIWDPSLDIADREWFRAQKYGGHDTYISEPFEGRASGKNTFSFSRRRSNADGSFGGIIQVSINPDYFEQFFKEAGPPIEHVATLVRMDGVILSRQPASPASNKGVAGSPIRRLLESSPSEVAEWVVSSIDGKDYFYAFRRVGTYPIYVGYGVEKSNLLIHWYGHVAVYSGVAATASLTLFMVSLLALRRARAEQAALLKLREESEQRLVAEKRLRQSQKMESLGQLTGGIAHDFNNLLAIIMSNIEMATKRVTDDRTRYLLDNAMRGANRGATLTQRLLTFARQRDLLPQSVCIPGLVSGILDMLIRTIGPNIRIVTDFPDNLPPVRVDPNQLEFALLNLVVNARDAMPDGGAITISSRSEMIGQDEHGPMSPGPYVCISVTDTGGGMDDDTLVRAIEPFFTTKEIGKGTGLGLSMVHGLAVQSGGEFKLRSTKGAGTTAEIWLPQGDESEVCASPSQEPDSNDRLSVLLIDDDDLVLSSTKAMLEDLGHHVVAVSSGEAALEAIRRGTRVNIVVADFAMPGMTGLQLAVKIRAMRPTMPILIASGHAELPTDAEVDLPRLKKPFKQADLAAAVQSVIGMHSFDGRGVFSLRESSKR